MAGAAAQARATAAALLPRLQLPAGQAAEADFAQRRPRAEALLWAARAWLPADASKAAGYAQEAATLMQPPAAGDDNASRRWLLAMALTEQAEASAAQREQARPLLLAALQAWGLGDNSAPAVPPLLAPWLARTQALARTLRASDA
jgi:hypothetical protein